MTKNRELISLIIYNKEEIDKMAEKKGISRGALIRLAIAEYIERNK